MRLERLEVSGFRGIGGDITVDLNADVVILTGPNGHGKTSLMDAIQWCMVGSIGRLRVNDRDLVSLYSVSGDAMVRLILRDDTGLQVDVVRTTDGDESWLHVQTEDGRSAGLTAAAKLAEILRMSDDQPVTNEASLTLPTADRILSRAFYLEQDAMSAFVTADTEEERFEALSSLVGAGSVPRFQATLERAKARWTRSVNESGADLESLRDQLSGATRQRERIEEVARPDATETLKAWQEWVRSVGAVGGEIGRAASALPRDVAQAIDFVLRKVVDRKNRLARERSEIEALRVELEDVGLALANTRAAEVTSAELVETIQQEEELRARLFAAQERRQAEHQRVLQERDRAVRLARLAELALPELGDECPVCGQRHSVESTRDRLGRLVGGAHGGGGGDDSAIGESEAEINSLRAQMAGCERTAERLREEQVALERTLRRQKEVMSRLEGIGLATDDATSGMADIADRLEALGNEIAALTGVQAEGEELAAQAALLDEAGRIDELRAREADLRGKLDVAEREFAARSAAGDVAQRLIEALREASKVVVGDEIERMRPLIQEIFSTVDPHPSLTDVEVRVGMHRGKGTLALGLSDPVSGRRSRVPRAILSTAQMSAYALSVFLAMNLRASNTPLRCALLDDPFQALDDVSVLGVVDLLRRVAEHRQIVVSTHDRKLSSLLARKLRPSHARGRTTVVEMQAWTPEKLEFRQWDVRRAGGLAIVA